MAREAIRMIECVCYQRLHVFEGVISRCQCGRAYELQRRSDETSEGANGAEKQETSGEARGSGARLSSGTKGVQRGTQEGKR